MAHYGTLYESKPWYPLPEVIAADSPSLGGFHGYGDAPIGGYWMTTGGTPYDLGNHQATSLPDFHSHLQPSLLASPAPWGPTSEKSPNQNHSWLNNDHEIIYNNVLSKSTWMYIHHEDIR